MKHHPKNLRKAIGVIPARYGSTRFPGKPLVDLLGKPLIQWVIEGAQKSELLQKVIVATDDQRIFNTVSGLGVEVVMTPSELQSGTDRVLAALLASESSLNPIDEDSVIVNIQGDEPLIEAKLIDQVIGLFLNESKSAPLDMATLAHPISLEELASPNAVKVIVNKNSEAIYFSRYQIPYSRSTAPTTGPIAGCMKHIGMYAYSFNFLKKFCNEEPALIEVNESLEQLRALYLGARIKVLPVAHSTPGVDTPEDLERVKTLLQKG